MDDAGALGMVHVQTWQAAYRGQVPQDYLDKLDPVQRQSVWEHWLRDTKPPAGTSVLIDDRHGVMGFVSVSPSLDPDTDPLIVGQVSALYLLPAHWRKGAGTVLMNAGLRRLADAGFRQAILWVLESNVRARRFYEACGWRSDDSVKTDDSLGFPLVEIRYRRMITL